jgi:hypothetical protein
MGSSTWNRRRHGIGGDPHPTEAGRVHGDPDPLVRLHPLQRHGKKAHRVHGLHPARRAQEPHGRGLGGGTPGQHQVVGECAPEARSHGPPLGGHPVQRDADTAGLDILDDHPGPAPHPDPLAAQHDGGVPPPRPGRPAPPPPGAPGPAGRAPGRVRSHGPPTVAGRGSPLRVQSLSESSIRTGTDGISLRSWRSARTDTQRRRASPNAATFREKVPGQEVQQRPAHPTNRPPAARSPRARPRNPIRGLR